jgi:hypothetical protein
MKRVPRNTLVILGATALMALSGAGYASASGSAGGDNGPKGEQTGEHRDAGDSNAKATEIKSDEGKTEKNSGAESSADTAAQAAACEKAGVSGDNVNYDDATGTCSADSGNESGPEGTDEGQQSENASE